MTIFASNPKFPRARCGAAGVVLVAALVGTFAIHAQTTGQVTPPPTDETSPPIAIPPELSDAARRAYNQGLKDATTLMTQKNYAAAIAKLDTLIAQRPREPQARFLKGSAQTEQGNLDAAFATFRALVEDYPELPEPHNNLAVLYAQKGEYDIAKSELEIAIKSAPDWPVAHENLGDIYARLAAVQYDRAGSLDKANTTAPAKLALVRQLLTPSPAKPKS